jgi:hypothetical protein
LAWLGYRRVACHCNGCEYVRLVTHSDRCVLALLVMSANVVTCIGRAGSIVLRGVILRWPQVDQWGLPLWIDHSLFAGGAMLCHLFAPKVHICHWTPINVTPSICQHTYEWGFLLCSVHPMTLQPAIGWSQSSLTWRLLPTMSLFWRCPINNLFLLNPWIGQSLDTAIPA